MFKDGTLYDYVTNYWTDFIVANKVIGRYFLYTPQVTLNTLLGLSLTIKVC